jgi:molybdenum cofactor cytidylyltransferase
MISVVVLAARRSRQLVEQNAPAPLTDKPVLQRILENVLASEVDEVICVADDLAAARREIKLTDRRLIWHLNTAARRGQSTAVITGVWASHPESDGVMFVAAEPPLVPKELINTLLDRFVKSPASIITARRDQPPNPILFRRYLYPELLKLTGDDSGLSLLERHIEKTALVEWPEEYLANMAERQTYASFKERL